MQPRLGCLLVPLLACSACQNGRPDWESLGRGASDAAEIGQFAGAVNAFYARVLTGRA